MKTVDKALSVLDQFSSSQTEIGLSELSRMAGLDKAATRRLLVALSKHDFIEQVEETRRYRLGPGFLRLARIRETTVPVSSAAQEVANWLAAETNETAHVSIPGQYGMTSVAHCLPNRAWVVNMEPAQMLFYHATASGMVFMAFATPETLEKALRIKREKITGATVTSKPELQNALKRFRAQGYSETRDTFEADVASIAMPFFCGPGDPTGTIALALRKADMTRERRNELLPPLKEAVQRIEKALTGF